MFVKFLLFCSAASGSYYLYFLLRRWIRWFTSPLHKLPGPKRDFFLGIMPELMKQPFMEPHGEWIKDAGGPNNVDILHYTTLMGGSSLLILNADYIKTILMADYKGNPPRFQKKLKILERITGPGMITLEGDHWHRHRRIIHPSFQVSFLKEHVNRSVPCRAARLLKCWKQAGSSRTIDVLSHFNMLSLDILGDIAFAHDFGGLNVIEEWANTVIEDETNDASASSSGDELPPLSDRIVQSLTASMHATPTRILLNSLRLSWLDLDAARARSALNDAVSEVVKNARRRYEESGRSREVSSSSKYAARSVLEVLLDAKDSQHPHQSSKNFRTLSDAELGDEIKTFLVAGHETTSTWCHWAVYCLCQYPDIQDRVYQDIVKHAPPSDGEEAINVDTVDKMAYFDAFLKEVLRMYSPVGMVTRHNTTPEKFGNVIVPKYTRLVIASHILHRSPRYWKDPDEFRPERWLGDTPPYSHPCAFLPFSNGPRICIGNRFATMEAKLILAPIIRKVRFEIIPELRDVKFTLTFFITVKAKPNFKIHAKFRE